MQKGDQSQAILSWISDNGGLPITPNIYLTPNTYYSEFLFDYRDVKSWGNNTSFFFCKQTIFISNLKIKMMSFRFPTINKIECRGLS
jgi:hypothetical protein